MDLKSPTTLVAAWVLVPLLVAAASAGLGVGLRLLAGIDLRALTLPAGFLAGIAAFDVLLRVGLSGLAASLVLAALALAGPAWLAARERDALRARARAARRPWPPPAGAWAGLAALAAYGIGMAPLVGTGRSGVLGYVLNNDPAAHVMIVDWLSQNAAEAPTFIDSSYAVAATAVDSGYPLGTYAWPVFGTALSGLDPFHLWSPLIAVAMAMLALVCFALLRRLDAAPAFAAAGGALAASGFLPLSYLAQGGAKELLIAVTVLGTVALAAHALERGAGWRALLPAVLAAGAAIANLGYAALAWLGPAGLAVLALIVVRARRDGRVRELRGLAIVIAAGALVALPAALASLDFFRASRLEFEDPNEVGNLLGPLPLAETLNVWLALDYRMATPTAEVLTWVGVALAAGAALLGLVHVVARREVAIPLALATAVVGAALVYPRVSIYFEAKTLVVVAPALGLLSAAGVLWLARRPERGARAGAVALGGLLAVGALASSAFVYAGAWNTPRDRFQELADIGERYGGRGPLLVNDREYYADHFLRRSDAWNSWAERPVLRELRSEDSLPPPMPHTPDFDDYTAAHLRRFDLLLERRRPGGSRPPGNFALDFEGAHYRVWRRAGPDPDGRVPVGNGVTGSERLRCGDRAVRRLLARASREGRRVRVSTRPDPVRVLQLDAWLAFERPHVQPPDELVGRAAGTGIAAGETRLAPGRYRVWIQGSYGPGVRLWAMQGPVGDAINDLGLPSQWLSLGEVETTPEGGLRIALVPLERSLLRPGSRHHELSGAPWVEPVDATWTVREVEPAAVRRLCGQPVDWLELPAR